MIDVPEDQSDGTVNNRGNYCTLSPIFKNSDSTYGSVGTFISGNLEHSSVGSTTNAWTTFALPPSGKYYWEVRFSSLNSASVGIFAADGNVNRSVLYTNTGTIVTDNSTTQSGLGSWTSGDRIGIAYNADVSPKTIQFYRQNVAQGTATNITTYTFDYFPFARCNAYGEWNFGQFPFTYTPPTGFKSLNTYNLPEPTIKQPNKHMDAILYTGNNGTLTVTGVAFQSDLLWFKRRAGTGFLGIYNSLTTLGASLSAGGTGVEVIPSPNDSLTAINSNGFTLGPNNNSGAQDINYTSGSTYVAWLWNAGGSTVSNTSVSITSTVRANPTAGFSIVTYTGTGSNATVGHGLGVAPSMVIVKTRSLSGENWNCWHTSLGGNTYRILLNTTGAVDTTSPTIWSSGGINPTSTTFTVGTNSGTNGSAATYVAYCWTPIAGYSAFGSYTGNGSTDGTFVYTGFRPKFILAKASSGVADWVIVDTARDTYNGIQKQLFPNLADAESSGTVRFDALSNGFKLRVTSDPNNSGVTYIYAAFAEVPFKYSRSR
jgi:hypothetical protein